MRTDHLADINAARRARRAVILLTELESGVGRVIREGEAPGVALQAEIDRAFRTGKSGTIEADGKKLFLNVLVPPPRIAVIGAVHISQALAVMAPVAGSMRARFQRWTKLCSASATTGPRSSRKASCLCRP